MDLLCFFLSCDCYVFVHVCLSAGKGLTSWVSFVVSGCEFVTFPLVSWVRCVYLIVSIPDLCTLTYFAPLLTLVQIAYV